MTDHFDDTLLANFAQTFYGYGDYNGDYWFVGMEEGGGDSFQYIENCIVTWGRLGRRELEDVVLFNKAIGQDKFFSDSARLQPTWNKLIRILLRAEGHEVTTEKVRQYQIERLGRIPGQNCLIEILPLPSPSTSHWIYKDYSDLTFLTNREVYKNYYIPRRIRHIQDRIAQYRPKVVVFYGLAYQTWWQQIAGAPFIPSTFDRTSLAKQNGTLFLMTKHPVAKGITSDYFHNVGRLIVSET
jgi:hypothetical protein